MMRLNLRRRRVGATRVVATLAIAALAVAACASPSATAGPAASPSPDGDALRVIATTTVLADLVAQVGGQRVDVQSLVPKGGEVHTFDPTPSDVQRIAQAQLVIMNGLGLDEWLGSLVADAGTDATIVELAEDLEGVELLAGEEHEGEEAEAEDEHEGEEFNPHLWLNVAYATKYVDRIEAALIEAAPADAAAFTAGAEAYRTRLAALHAWAIEETGRIPEDGRKVVSFHEAFPYFAAAYGLQIIGTVVDAPGQDPSAGALATLIREIRESGAKAIFAESQFSDDLVRTIAAETDAVVVSNLYNDSLGDAPVDTYEGMMRWNVERVVEALAP
jgi:zinc/manganese transport system substrate-binding protein/manganese/iron transport system substrate-binding protein